MKIESSKRRKYIESNACCCEISAIYRTNYAHQHTQLQNNDEWQMVGPSRFDRLVRFFLSRYLRVSVLVESIVTETGESVFSRWPSRFRLHRGKKSNINRWRPKLPSAFASKIHIRMISSISSSPMIVICRWSRDRRRFYLRIPAEQKSGQATNLFN